jgi:regulator of protease activity HflC (stomatin/prohibitin superfamily)
MGSAFQWIADLFATLQAFIPTWDHVRHFEAAVYLKGGRVGVDIKPGIFWYWPFWTTVVKVERVRQTTKLRTELLTKDSVAVTVGAMVRYQIDDSVLALAETYDLDAAIEDETLAVLCDFITTRAVSEVQDDRPGVNTKITLKVRSALKPYGIAVERAQLTAFAEGVLLIHAGSVPTVTTDEGE